MATHGFAAPSTVEFTKHIEGDSGFFERQVVTAGGFHDD